MKRRANFEQRATATAEGQRKLRRGAQDDSDEEEEISEEKKEPSDRNQVQEKEGNRVFNE